MRKGIIVGFILWSMLFAVLPVMAREGHLEVIGVAEDVVVGRYDSKEGVFLADVREFPDGLVRVSFEETRIEGQVLEWYTKDDYLLFPEAAQLFREDMKVTSARMEYYSEDEILVASGEVRVETDDAVVYADHMVYDEAADRAEFTGSVVVEIEEGIFRGERCVMYPDAEEMEFIGPFAGEFWRN